MKTIRVVAAIIFDGGKLFATQRGYGAWRDYWEFPGGKIEPGETPQEALAREIREDLEPLENVIFGIMRDDVDDSLERYRDVCARNKANRSRSSLPPGEYYVLPDGDPD